MPNSPPTLRLQNYLPYRLSVAANAVSRRIARAYEDRFGLTIAQWRLLAVLADEGPLTQQSLCGRTIMDKVTVMRAARELVRRRLLRRLPNPADGRSHRLVLSRTGRHIYRQIVLLALEHQARLLDGISSRDRDRLEGLLRQLEHTAAHN
jgi:DNA-binding MarR family transcriptional regulator